MKNLLRRIFFKELLNWKPRYDAQGNIYMWLRDEPGVGE